MTKKKESLDEAKVEETTKKTIDREVIAVDHVTYAYPMYGERKPDPVLRDVTIHIKEGEFVALLGHNGSGKSTLARLLNAQMLPQEGSIRILGMDTAEEENLWKIRSQCGMVFQNPDNQIVASIVEEDVAFGPENLGVPNPALRERVDMALKATGMTEYRRREPYKLSGGQKQRVAIAGVLAMLPSCLIMDEPTAMLDPVGRREIIETILHLNREENKTIVLITHNMEEAVEADRVIVLNDGQIALEGSPRAVFSQVETMRKLELDVPQVTEVGYQLQQEGFAIPSDALTIQELMTALLKAPVSKGEKV